MTGYTLRNEIELRVGHAARFATGASSQTHDGGLHSVTLINDGVEILEILPDGSGGLKVIVPSPQEEEVT